MIAVRPSRRPRLAGRLRRWLCTTAVALLSVAAVAMASPLAEARRGPRPTLACDGSAAAHLRHIVAPRNCDILYPNLPLLGGVQLQRLHWSHWGSRTATSVGISHGFHAGPSWTIDVRVWRLRQSSCTGGSWYTRLSVPRSCSWREVSAFAVSVCPAVNGRSDGRWRACRRDGCCPAGLRGRFARNAGVAAVVCGQADAGLPRG
jgi:hypothetical protein